MPELPNSPIETNNNGDSSDGHLETLLLDTKEWLYVERRYSLTPRECQIAELLCRGLRNGNIAKYLRIRPGTVKTHTRNIYRKVRVKSKIGMLLRFVADARELYFQHDRTRSIQTAD